MHYNFRIGVSTARNIVYETCEAIWSSLSPVFLKYPTEEDWIEIAADFQDKLRFPNCVGAIDGKHIEIVAPRNSGSMYFNYLKYFSIILLAISDANKNFTYVDIGAYGTQSDGGVLFYSTFGQRLDRNKLHFPPPLPLPYTNVDFPFFIIGDAAFPLHEHILTPYPGRYYDLSDIQINYNKEHSSVRKNAENIFAILVKRWRILIGPIDANPEEVDKIVKACVALHNFVKAFQDNASFRYMRENDDNLPSISRLRNFDDAVLIVGNGPTTTNTRQIHNNRDIYANYLFHVN